MRGLTPTEAALARILMGPRPWRDPTPDELDAFNSLLIQGRGVIAPSRQRDGCLTINLTPAGVEALRLHDAMALAGVTS